MKILDQNPLIGNLLLAVLFGVPLLWIAEKFFHGNALYIGLAVLGMFVFFMAGSAYDREHQNPLAEFQTPAPKMKEKDVIAYQQQQIKALRTQLAERG